MEAKRAQPSVHSALTPATTGGAPRDVWAAIARPSAPGANGDLWRHLGDRLDLGSAVPRPAAAVVVSSLTGRDGGRYYVLRSPSWQYLRLEPDDFALWQRIDGRATVREIAVAQFVERGEFVAERLARLIQVLRAGGFVEAPAVDCFVEVRDRLRSSFLRKLGRRAAHVFTRPLAQLRNPDRLFGAIYHAVGWLLFTQLAQVLWLLIVVFGLWTWWYQFVGANHPLFQTRGSYGLGFIVLTTLDGLGVSLHNFAQ